MAYTTIDNPELYFQTKIYTGDGNDNRSITFDGSENMSPDWVWIKSRSHATWHNVYDSVRGANKSLASNANNAQESRSDTMDSFDSNGFTVGNDTSQSPNGLNTNASGYTYVAWCWKAGTTSGINTTSSTITHIGYSFNQTSGFSIVRYHGNETAGAKIPHGLNQKPAMIILKNLNNTEQWCVYHHKNTSEPATDYLLLDNTSATADTNVVWNDTEPDTVNVTLGGNDIVNKNGEDLVGYIFAEKQGFSRFASYQGNSNANGSFIWCGFSPSFIMVKKTNETDSADWLILDNKRDTYNPRDSHLDANQADAESSASWVYCDFLSNGFKWRANDETHNESGSTYIFMAFAYSPFVNSNGIPNNAV